jgi:hypothetical protein
VAPETVIEAPKSRRDSDAKVLFVHHVLHYVIELVPEVGLIVSG